MPPSSRFGPQTTSRQVYPLKKTRMNKSDHIDYLKATRLLDHDHPALRARAAMISRGAADDKQRAVRIYYAVRDGWKYNPYNVNFQPEAYRASNLLQQTEGHCLDKAILMIALLRASGIPARLCLAKVRNHIAAEKVEAAFGTDELVPHGYVEMQINGKWIKATPAFNRELCKRLQVDPLEFDGERDALFQECDGKGGAFMEYLEEYGRFADVPVSLIARLMRSHYPDIFEGKDKVDREMILAADKARRGE